MYSLASTKESIRKNHDVTTNSNILVVVEEFIIYEHRKYFRIIRDMLPRTIPNSFYVLILFKRKIYWKGVLFRGIFCDIRWIFYVDSNLKQTLLVKTSQQYQ